MAESPAEEDLSAGRVLLSKRTPEELAAMLVRIRRELLPAPEVIDDPPPVKPEVWGNKSKRPQFGGKTKFFPKGRAGQEQKWYKKKAKSNR